MCLKECRRVRNALTVLSVSGPVDEARHWQEFTGASYVKEYNNTRIFAAFGSTETSISSGVDATTAANDMGELI